MLWETSDGVCCKRVVVMIPTLLPVLERTRAKASLRCGWLTSKRFTMNSACS